MSGADTGFFQGEGGGWLHKGVGSGKVLEVGGGVGGVGFPSQQLHPPAVSTAAELPQVTPLAAAAPTPVWQIRIVLIKIRLYV